MSWTLLDPIKAGAKADVVASLLKIRETAPVRLSIVFRGQVLASLLKFKGGVAVALGSGDHEGQLKFSAGGPFQLTLFRKGGGRIVLHRPNFLPNEKRAALACEHAIEDGSVFVTLPAFTPEKRDLVQNVSSRPPIATPPSSTATPSVKNVTHALMGDPPRGRSALDQRGGRG